MATTTIRDFENHEKLRIMAAGMGFKPNQAGGQNMKDDTSDFDQQTGAQTMPGATVQDPELASAPYVKLLTKLGYEFQGHDEDLGGGKIGSSFTGMDGDTIMVKPDGSWRRFGPGAQNTSGKDVPSLGQALVRDTLSQGDDENHHGALRQAGYNKVHTDGDGNSYYKHPQTGKSVHVTKEGRWGSSVGSGRGAGKLRDFLGNEQMEGQDPQMLKMKMDQQALKRGGGKAGSSAGGAGGRAGAGPVKPGTRSGTGTRGL